MTSKWTQFQYYIYDSTFRTYFIAVNLTSKLDVQIANPRPVIHVITIATKLTCKIPIPSNHIVVVHSWTNHFVKFSIKFEERFPQIAKEFLLFHSWRIPLIISWIIPCIIPRGIPWGIPWGIRWGIPWGIPRWIHWGIPWGIPLQTDAPIFD